MHQLTGAVRRGRVSPVPAAASADTPVNGTFASRRQTLRGFVPRLRPPQPSTAGPRLSHGARRGPAVLPYSDGSIHTVNPSRFGDQSHGRGTTGCDDY